MPTISNDLRQRILDVFLEGTHTRQQIADRFKVSLGFVKKIIQQHRHLGSIGILHHRAGRKRMITVELEEKPKKLVREQPDATLEELRGRLGLECYPSTIHRALVRLGESFKKKNLAAEEQNREDVKAEREQWKAGSKALDARRLVFVDETGAKTNVTRRYGRAPVGERVQDHAPAGHWGTTTLISAVREGGSIAPLLIEGATDADVFTAWVGLRLSLQLSKGDIVVMDNLSSHKAKAVGELIAARGATLLYLPAYSPDLNPIEKMWSKIKALLRGAKARTMDALAKAVSDTLSAVTTAEVQ